MSHYSVLGRKLTLVCIPITAYSYKVTFNELRLKFSSVLLETDKNVELQTYLIQFLMS